MATFFLVTQNAVGTQTHGILNGHQQMLEKFLPNHVLVHKVSKFYSYCIVGAFSRRKVYSNYSKETTKFSV